MTTTLHNWFVANPELF